MYFLIDWYEATLAFLDLGGQVLVVIAWVLLFMWTLIVERVLYFRTAHRRMVAQTLEVWEARGERRSWNAFQIRAAMVSRVSMDANMSLPMIKTLVALCPLLGLTGTVTGMIEVFDVMAFIGTGSARSMAAGVSKATVPTMAGMVGALSGVFASIWLSRKADREVEMLQDNLTMDH